MALDSVLSFPCDFIVKVMGKADSPFEAQVMRIIKAHAFDCNVALITKRLSKDQHYIALTIPLYAESQQQLDSLYQDFSKEPNILMAL